MGEIELTPEQCGIRDGLMDWVARPTDYIAMSGYAGTGKTTVIGNTAATILKENPNKALRFLTFTGKASMVLSQKLNSFGISPDRATCSTIHSYMYLCLGMNKKTLQPEFARKMGDTLEGDILVIDEASMISTKLFSDLLRLEKPMIFVGDPGQLPPINDTVFQPLVDTELSLKVVHRQAQENPIIRLATDTRNHIPIPKGVVPGGKVAKFCIRDKKGKQVFESFQAQVGKEDTVILCGKNYTRVSLNRRVRYTQGFVDVKPVSGERMVCLKNDKAKQLFNGQCVYVKKADVITNENIPEDDIALYMVVQPEGEERNIECMAYAKSINNSKPSELNKKMGADKKALEYLTGAYPHLGDLTLFDYGYAMSVHKSQGSEWEKVVLRDERMGVQQSEDDYYRWLYTGVTRAKDKLLILSDN